MTPTDNAKMQAAYNELRSQREMALDRCANLAQELAAKDLHLHSLAAENAKLAEENRKLKEDRGDGSEDVAA